MAEWLEILTKEQQQQEQARRTCIKQANRCYETFFRQIDQVLQESLDYVRTQLPEEISRSFGVVHVKSYDGSGIYKWHLTRHDENEFKDLLSLTISPRTDGGLSASEWKALARYGAFHITAKHSPAIAAESFTMDWLRSNILGTLRQVGTTSPDSMNTFF